MSLGGVRHAWSSEFAFCAAVLGCAKMETTLTLGELNSRLARAGITVSLTPTSAAYLKTLVPRERLLAVVSQAANDARAKAFLLEALGRAGLYESAVPAKAAASAPPPAAAGASERPAVQRPPSVHVYAGKGALCFEADATRDGAPTVAIDAANAIEARRYDWEGKIRLQLTVRELPVVAAVLLGLVPACEFKNHGPANDKGFSMECQGDKVFVRVFAKGHGVRSVPIDAPDAFRVLALVLRQLRRQSPWLDGAQLWIALRALARRIGRARGGARTASE
jgi:hypothetical protein